MTSSAPSVSLPVAIVNVPVVVSEVSLLSAGSATSPDPSARPFSSTVPSLTVTLGTEFACKVIETVAVEVSPSPSVIV